MERARNHVFRFTFPSIRTSTPFQFLANGWHSEEHVATPFAMPNLAGLRVQATPPGYTGLPAIDQRNQGDLTLPEGTPVQWTVSVGNGTGLRMRLGDAPLEVRTGAANTFHSNWVASKNTAYWLTPTGDGVVGDSLRHRIRVIRDGKPTISVAEEADSTSRKRRHFTGNIQDDYGFSRLSFVWSFAERGARTQADEASATSPEPQAQEGRQELDVPGSTRAFFHTWEMGAIDWLLATCWSVGLRCGTTTACMGPK